MREIQMSYAKLSAPEDEDCKLIVCRRCGFQWRVRVVWLTHPQFLRDLFKYSQDDCHPPRQRDGGNCHEN
jgi:hypothetical protein